MIPFNKPHMSGKELYYIAEAHLITFLLAMGLLLNGATHGLKLAREVQKFC